jgi:hypothetical protein
MGVGFIPSACSFSTNALGALGSTPTRNEARAIFRSNWKGMVRVLASLASAPCSTLNTRAQSSTVRHMGPTRSWLQLSTMPPWRLTRP